MVLLSAQRPLAMIALAFLLATGGPARVEAAGFFSGLWSWLVTPAPARSSVVTQPETLIPLQGYAAVSGSDPLEQQGEATSILSDMWGDEGAEADEVGEEEEGEGEEGNPLSAVGTPRRRRAKTSCLTTYKGHKMDVELTPFGRRTHTIVFASLGGGSTCGGSRDWRANLPRFMGMFARAHVIVFDARGNKCQTCWSPNKRPMDCELKLKKRVDLLVVLGSGKLLSTSVCAPGDKWCPAMHLDLRLTMGRPWARKAVRTVHFPIRNMDRLMNNKVFDFDVIIDDGSFAKPISECAVTALQKCMQTPKNNTLVYVGRFVEHKGQLAFIEKADPELLKGYTIEMYGPKQRPQYITRLKEVARERRIKVHVEGKVGKSHLFQKICSAKGLVIQSVDKNPRSVYEGVVAGLPAFVSKEAQVSSTLTNMPFVVETERTTNTPDEFNDALLKFMHVIQHDWTQQINEWREEEMSSEAVYKGLCQRMGVCAPGKYGYEPWDFGDAGKPSKRMTMAMMRRQKEYALVNVTDESSIVQHSSDGVHHSKVSMRINLSNAAKGMDEEGSAADSSSKEDGREDVAEPTLQRRSRSASWTPRRGTRSGRAARTVRRKPTSGTLATAAAEEDVDGYEDGEVEAALFEEG